MKWYKHDPDAFKSGTAGLTLEEIGAYVLVMDEYYSRDGHLPDDDYLLSRVLRCNQRTWRRLKLCLFQKQKLTVDGGKLVPNRGPSTLLEAQRFRERQAKRARTRWERGEKPNQNNQSPMPLPAMPLQPQPQYKKEERPIVGRGESEGGDLFAGTPPPPARQKSNGKTPLPADWQPKGEQRDLTEADEFRNHAKAKDYRYKDWDAAYSNFQGSKYNRRNTNGGGNGHGRRRGSVLDVIDDVIEHTGGYETEYVPGSQGPRPLELDRPKSPPGLRLIPKR